MHAVLAEQQKFVSKLELYVPQNRITEWLLLYTCLESLVRLNCAVIVSARERRVYYTQCLWLISYHNYLLNFDESLSHAEQPSTYTENYRPIMTPTKIKWTVLHCTEYYYKLIVQSCTCLQNTYPTLCTSCIWMLVKWQYNEIWILYTAQCYCTICGFWQEIGFLPEFSNDCFWSHVHVFSILYCVPELITVECRIDFLSKFSV